jgi:hypothetical protein
MEFCDSTVQNCDSIDPPTQKTINEACSNSGTVHKRAHITSNDGLFLVSGIQLVAGIHLLVGSVWARRKYLDQTPGGHYMLF